MNILTLIVTYNGTRWLEHCLADLSASTVHTDVLVVDNCSTDNTVEFISNNYPDIILFPQSVNLGFGQANNIGLRYALSNNYDFVLLLNQDAYLQPDALELLLKESDGMSLLTPIHMSGDGKHIDYVFKKYSLLKADNTLIDDLLVSHVKTAYPIGEVCAACWFMPIGLIKKIGGFNPLFAHYGEDNNYYQRMVYHNCPVIVVPKARVFHDREVHGNMTAFNSRLIEREMLLTVSNINISSFMHMLKPLTSLMYKFRATPLGFIKAFSKILLQNRKVVVSRKTDGRVGTNWL